jgi:mono/diheme cytochrome c family protein
VPFKVSRKDAAVAAFAGASLASIPVALGAGDPAVERGHYLFAAADCTSCHTDDKHKGQPLAGGPPLVTAFGVFFAPNITPDPTFGIGKWSYADFHRALRSGIGHDGSYLYPVFPYPSFTHLTDEDISDIYAYLRTQKPVAQASRTSNVKPPFGWRFLLWFWRALFFRQGMLPKEPDKSPEWQRGHYLAEAVGHCQECHTPRNILGALEESRAYSGNPNGPDRQDAPNITSDPSSVIATWSIDDVTQLLATGQTPEFDFVGAGMAQVVKGTSALSETDRHAIAVYVKSLPPIHTEKRPKKPSGST